MKKRAFICALAFTGLLTFVNSPVLAEDAQVITENIENTEIEPRTDILEWRFKVIGDHLYKRLYNASTGEWVTDWILVQ